MPIELQFGGGRVRFSSGAEIEYAEIPAAFAPGRRYPLQATNGSGKTTLARCFAGAIPEVFRAAIDFRGTVGAYPLFAGFSHEHEKFSVLPQNHEEFFLGFETGDELRLSAAHASGPDWRHLDALIECFELNPLMQKCVWMLSQGERQRVALACVLAQRRTWLVLDEWSARLDSDWRKRLDVLLTAHAADTGAGVIELTTEASADGSTLETRVSGRRQGKPFSLAERQCALTLLLESKSPNPVADARFVELVHDGRLRRPGFRKDIGRISVGRGKALAIVGKNAAGKTTALQGFRSRHQYRLFNQQPTIVLANPYLQVATRSFSSLAGTGTGSPKLGAVITAHEAIRVVLNLPSDETDPLEINFSAAKLLALIIGVTNDQLGLVVDEPLTGLDADARQLAETALDYALTRRGKAIVVSLHEKPVTQTPFWARCEFQQL